VRVLRAAIPLAVAARDVLRAGVPPEGRGGEAGRAEATGAAEGGELTMEDREFWHEVRRWLKTRILADQQMIKAIEARFGFEETKAKDRPSSTAA